MNQEGFFDDFADTHSRIERRVRVLTNDLHLAAPNKLAPAGKYFLRLRTSSRVWFSLAVIAILNAIWTNQSAATLGFPPARSGCVRADSSPTCSKRMQRAW